MTRKERIEQEIFLKRLQIEHLRNQSKNSPRLFELTIARINRDIKKLQEELADE